MRVGANHDDEFAVAETSSPWFLKPWVLALWALAVVVLIAIIVYGLVILANDHRGNAPSTRQSTSTSSSRAPTSTTTPSSTPPTTTAPSAETTPEAPPVTTQPWTQQQRPRHRWWNGNMPQLPGLPPIRVPGVNP